MGVKLRYEQRLRVFGNRVLRRMFGRKGEEVGGGGEGSIMRSFVMAASPNVIRVIK